MPIFEHSKKFDNALLFSRFDVQHPLATVSPPGFELEGRGWLTAEHYYQSCKQRNRNYGDLISHTLDPMDAYKMGNCWYRAKRADFKKVRVVLMTRALYSKTIQNQAVSDYLLASADQTIVEVSQYDPYWGIGRDHRGANHLGKIWMDIRARLTANIEK